MNRFIDCQEPDILEAYMEMVHNFREQELRAERLEKVVGELLGLNRVLCGVIRKGRIYGCEN